MAFAMNVSSSSSSQVAPVSPPPLLQWQKFPLLSPSTCPAFNKKASILPIRCRFARPSRNTPSYTYSWRSPRVASNMETGVPTSVPVRVAHELLQAGHRYLDVRTPEEFSAGHIPGALNIPYMYRVGSGMTKNPNFLAQVSSQFHKDDEILIGCQSGKRSLMAASDLQSAGYTGIVDVAGGYAAWTQTNLPTE